MSPSNLHTVWAAIVVDALAKSGGRHVVVSPGSRSTPLALAVAAHDALSVEVAIDERTRPFLEAGRTMFYRRQGQLNFACAQCHDDNWSGRLAGAPITQAHPTGYPIYRLEWQGVGSVQRRFRNCMIGVRAEPYAYGAPEYVELEMFLMWRARGMKLETPAVRP